MDWMSFLYGVLATIAADILLIIILICLFLKNFRL